MKLLWMSAGNAASAAVETAETVAAAEAVAETAATEATSEVIDLMLETQPIAETLQQDLAQLKPNVILETIKGWTPGLLNFAYHLVIAVIILILGIRIVRMLHKVLEKWFQKAGMDLSVSKFLCSVADAVGYAMVVFIAADKIGIPSASIIALLGSAGLAIGLSLQGSLANVAGGILVLLMRPFVVGDYIIAGNVEGTVHNIGLVYTSLITADNKKINIPNSVISNETVVNVTAQDKRRVDIEVGISYSSNMKQAKEIVRRIYGEHPQILQEEEIVVYVGSLADSAVMIGGRGWVKTENYWATLWEMTEAIKEEFDAAGIEIPYNQIDVNIRSNTDK